MGDDRRAIKHMFIICDLLWDVQCKVDDSTYYFEVIGMYTNIVGFLTV